MSRLPARRAGRGFTLIEAIIAIVLLGVIAGATAVFIRMPVQGYADSVARAELTDQADLALRRMARDLRLALPNSIRVSADRSAIEFMQAKTGGRYLSAEDGVDGAPALDFLNPANLSFAVVGALSSFPRAAIGDYVVVYNLGEGMHPSDAWQYGQADTNIARITAIAQQPIAAIDPAQSSYVLTLERNPFAQQSTPMPSPSQRFQVVSGPVSYYCAPGADGSLTLWRAWGYAIAATQAVPPAGGQRAPLATRLANCGIFDYGSPATRRSGLVVLALELKARNDATNSVRLVHQVHVDNTP